MNTTFTPTPTQHHHQHPTSPPHHHPYPAHTHTLDREMAYYVTIMTYLTLIQTYFATCWKLIDDHRNRWLIVIYIAWNYRQTTNMRRTLVFVSKIIKEMHCVIPGPLFTKRADVLSQDVAKSRSGEIRVLTFPIALQFDRHLSGSAAEMPVKLQSDTIIITPNLAASRLHKIVR